MNEMWYSKDIKDVLKYYKTSEKGLTNKEVKTRLSKYGYNKLPKAKKQTFIKILGIQFINPIIFILMITCIFSLVVQEYVDALFVFIVVVVDALLGSFQEWRAEKSAESLEKLIRVNCRVLRDGNEIMIDSQELVVGDIVLLESGQKVPADLRLIDSYNLLIDEAVLTGESLPREKNINILENSVSLVNRSNMAYASCSIIKGRGMGVVVATGINTEVGDIAHSVIMTKTVKSPLVIRTEKFTKQIGIYMAFFAVILVTLLYIKGFAPREIFFSVVALSISAIPEGLPIALTLALSVASSKMAKKNVIVKKLNSVESLGSCTVIATDKTGTLTLNEQTLTGIKLFGMPFYNISGKGYNDNGKLLCNDKDITLRIKKLSELGVLNNESKLIKENDKWEHYGDYIDVAFLAFGYKMGITDKIKDNVIGSIPYESENKYSACFYNEKEKVYSTVKGSPEKILNFCQYVFDNDKKVKIDTSKILEENSELARLGYRVIGLAYGEKKGKFDITSIKEEDIPALTFVGFACFVDPVRKETKKAVDSCHNAGVKVVMITGDHPLTAKAIAMELNIIDENDVVATGEDIIKYESLGEKDFDKFIKVVNVFSRVTPMQKLKIVESFRRQGEFVAVTGDGVNDAPAIKKANIGIAMGSGTDVAKETSTMIITDDNFSSIVSGVREGRIAYNNVRKVAYMLLSTGVSELMFFFLAILFNYPLPLVAVQLLWLNLITDGIQDVALSFEKDSDDVMNQKPRKTNEKLFDKLLCQETVLSGAVIGIIIFVFWKYLLDVKNYDIVYARSYILLLMVFIQNVHVFNCRSETKSILKIPFKNNPLIVFGIVSCLILQVLVTNFDITRKLLQITSLPIIDIVVVLTLSFPILFVMEIFKYIKFGRKKESGL